ncbi:MAG: DUF4825 domain-containing protein [Lachnospiraceae bacterium]|nr:DUF4825 domain-containing protein [Lachnospiraceae bacterium]
MSDIQCEVIRDLLPSYVDGLTSDVSNRLIEEHLKECEGCRSIYTSMKDPEGLQDGRAEESEIEKKEIDFLKKNRKRNGRILICSIIGVAVVLLIGLARIFLIGDGSYTSWTPLNLEVKGKELSFTAVPMNGAQAVADLSFSEKDGTVTINARSVQSSPVYPGKRYGHFSAGEEIREVCVGDRIIWAEGATVSSQAAELFATQHAYVGDMPANQRTASALGIGAFLGEYTNELETGAEPFGWKILLQKDIPSSAKKQKERDMDAFGRVLIGLTGNLDHVSFEYSVEGQKQTRTIDATSASAFLGEDIKNCGTSIRTLERLMDQSGISLYARSDQTAVYDNETWFRIVNQTDMDLASIGISCYKDGKLYSSGGGVNADESLIRIGEEIWFGFEELDFGGSWDENSVLEVEISMESQEGSSIVVPDKIRITSSIGRAGGFVLKGNASDGYRLVRM